MPRSRTDSATVRRADVGRDAAPHRPDDASPGDGIRDADLVARALDGDGRAEDALYRRHARHVVDTVRRLLGRYSDADDVVQDAFMIAFEQLKGLRDPGLFRAWLTQIAVTRVLRLLRRRRLQRALGLDRGTDDATLEALADTGVRPDVAADLALIDTILATVPASARVAWMLRYVEGFALAEVAGACGCSLATAKRWIAAVEVRVAAVMVVRAPDDAGGMTRE
jgi:RNA polymerase sigma-70 factor (ECF subfamily)